jgi:hypothetical protein
VPAQPSRADGPQHWCHALGMGTTWCACLGLRGGAPTEGSPTATAEEGFRGGHQRSEGMAPGKARVMGAHQRWPSRVRGRAGLSGWRLPVVRGSGDPSAASGGPAARDGGGGGEEQGLLAVMTSEVVLTVDME